MLKRLFATRKHPYVPSLNRPDKVEIDLSGSKLTMHMPPHSNYEGFSGKEPPERVNIYDSEQYIDDSALPEWRREGISHFNLFKRNWEFYGPPWRTRPYGTMYFGAGICRYDALPEGMSCFNPAHFEQMALRSLWFGGPAQPDLGRERAPINWHVRRESGATWLYFESHRDYSHNTSPPPDFMRTYRGSNLRVPLDDRYFLSMSFEYIGYAPVEYCLANMNAVRDSVLQSVRLELSRAARENLAEAKGKWPDARASEIRDPEPWVYPEWRGGDGDKGEERIVILKPGSPPPVLNP